MQRSPVYAVPCSGLSDRLWVRTEPECCQPLTLCAYWGMAPTMH
jgi:hypothetical protein